MKEFFEVFGIEPYMQEGRDYDEDGNVCSWYSIYPPITSDIVLGLEEIIINKYYNLVLNKAKDDYPFQYETRDLFTDWCKTKKEALLSLCIGYKDDIQDQVRALFNAK